MKHAKFPFAFQNTQNFGMQKYVSSGNPEVDHRYRRFCTRLIELADPQ
jgi:hypothetical protein